MLKFILSTALSFIWLFSIGQNASEIEKYIEKARKDWGVPGMAVGIVKDGKVFMSKGFGNLEIDKKEKVDGNSLFAIASNTKAFISSSLGVLVQQGKIDWEDKVTTHLPYFELYDHYATKEANIADLLSHRLGLGTFSGDVIWYRSELPAEEIVKRVKYVPQAYSFRAGYGYSNLMFITAGEVIKSVTGKPWNEFVSETFTKPLNMDRTLFTISDLDKKGNYAIPHKPLNGKDIPIGWTRWDNMGAAGGIISSANDMSKWMIFQLNNGVNGNDTVLEKNTQNKLWTPHNSYFISENGKKSMPGRHFNGYGLGFGIADYYGRMMVSHGGGYDGMYSRVVMLPDENLGVVVLTNTMKNISPAIAMYVLNQFIEEDLRDWSAEALTRSKANTHREETLKLRYDSRVPNTTPTLSKSSISGTYHADMYGDITIKEEGGKLKLEFEHSPELSATLEHWHYDTYEIKWDREHAWFDFGTIQFVSDNNQKVTGLEFDVPNYDIFFHELKVFKK